MHSMDNERTSYFFWTHPVYISTKEHLPCLHHGAYLEWCHKYEGWGICYFIMSCMVDWWNIDMFPGCPYICPSLFDGYHLVLDIRPISRGNFVINFLYFLLTSFSFIRHIPVHIRLYAISFHHYSHHKYYAWSNVSRHSLPYIHDWTVYHFRFTIPIYSTLHSYWRLYKNDATIMHDATCMILYPLTECTSVCTRIHLYNIALAFHAKYINKLQGVSKKRGAKNIAWNSTSQCIYYDVQLSIVHLIIKS